MRIIWLPYGIVFVCDLAQKDAKSVHTDVNTFIGSTVSEVIGNAPAILGAYVEPANYHGFVVLRVGTQRFLTLNGKILGQVDEKAKSICISKFTDDKGFDINFDVVNEMFPDFDVD